MTSIQKNTKFVKRHVAVASAAVDLIISKKIFDTSCVRMYTVIHNYGNPWFLLYSL